MATQSLISNEPREAEKRNTSVWQFDPAHSSAEFAVRHMMVSTVKGTFKTLSGTIAYDEANPERSQVGAEIDAASIETGVADRDTHLRSADFFDVQKFPKLTFRSTGIETDGADAGKMHGELTIHGVTRPVSLDVSYLGEVKDPWGNRRRGYTAETSLNRKDFGMTWNMVLDAGGVLVGDKIKVTLNIEAIEKAQA
jgi:polyisoprenoid-binding protein YceI